VHVSSLRKPPLQTGAVFVVDFCYHKSMKVIMIYKTDQEYSTAAEQYMRDFTRQTGRTIETLDPESRAGVSFCSTYDIMSFPTLIAVDRDGAMQNIWSDTLPTISEVSYYAQDN